MPTRWEVLNVAMDQETRAARGIRGMSGTGEKAISMISLFSKHREQALPRIGRKYSRIRFNYASSFFMDHKIYSPVQFNTAAGAEGNILRKVRCAAHYAMRT